MPMPLKDLTGMTFGKLTVIERAPNKGNAVCWRCKCSCGNETVVLSENLLKNHSKSCGCLSRKHGFKSTPVYNVWLRIKTRCLNKNSTQYPNYGARGISILPEWIDNFVAFYEYVSKLEHFGESGYSLDRINNDGNYEPGNLRWADNKTQSRNRRSNVFTEYRGRQVTLAEAAELSGINRLTLCHRYQRGDRGDYLFRPVKQKSSAEK